MTENDLKIISEYLRLIRCNSENDTAKYFRYSYEGLKPIEESLQNIDMNSCM